ncbi:MAG: hypothetical protein ABL930_09205 [Pseudobdellovibrio sp.]
MKLNLLIIVLLMHSYAVAKEIIIKNPVNLRLNEKNFFSQSTVVGQISKGAKVQVLVEKLLLSGNKAYKINVLSATPQSSAKNRSEKTELWIYGSPQFTEVLDKTKPVVTEAYSSNTKCESTCAASFPETKPVQAILARIEEDNAGSVTETASEKVNNLIKSGFSCNKNTESVQTRGYVCKGKFSFYDQNVRIYIPEKFENTKPAKFNLFFHGLKNNDTFQETADGRGVGDFGAMLKKSNDNNSILVVPESVNVKCGTSANGNPLYCTGSYYQFTNNPELITQMMSSIESKANIKLGELTLSGHSGAGSILNNLMGKEMIRKKVSKLALYDAIYGNTSNIKSWLKEDQNRKLSLSWIHGAGASTHANTEEFIKSMGSNLNQIEQNKIIGSTENTHMNIMQKAGLSEFLRN